MCKFLSDYNCSRINSACHLGLCIRGLLTAASIWFEIWGSWDRVTEIFDFVQKKFNFHENYRFSRQKIPMTFLVINSKMFSHKRINLTSTFLPNLFLFLENKLLSNMLSACFLCKIGYSIFRDPSTITVRTPLQHPHVLRV